MAQDLKEDVITVWLTASLGKPSEYLLLEREIGAECDTWRILAEGFSVCIGISLSMFPSETGGLCTWERY